MEAIMLIDGTAPGMINTTVITFTKEDNLIVSNIAKKFLKEKLSECFKVETTEDHIIFEHPSELNEQQKNIVAEVEEYIGHLLKIL